MARQTFTAPRSKCSGWTFDDFRARFNDVRSAVRSGDTKRAHKIARAMTRESACQMERAAYVEDLTDRAYDIITGDE